MRFECIPFRALVRVRAKKKAMETQYSQQQTWPAHVGQVATIKQQSRAVLMRSASEGTDSVDAKPCPGKLKKINKTKNATRLLELELVQKQAELRHT